MDYGSCHSHDECCGTLATAECAACIPGYSKNFNSVCDLHGINAKKCFHLKREMPQYETGHNIVIIYCHLLYAHTVLSDTYVLKRWRKATLSNKETHSARREIVVF